MKIVTNSKIAKKLGVYGIVIYPFILIDGNEKTYDKERYERLIRHEKIHYRQQKEMLVLPFYLFYLANFILNVLFFHFNGRLAYKNIIFEKEAKLNETKENYLKNRRFWGWTNYVFAQRIR